MAVYEGSVFAMAEAFVMLKGHEVPDACCERDCRSAPSLQCTYIDSGGGLCRTWWCAEHLVHLGEGLYCRRHAGTVAALGVKANDPRALPLVDHRGASLVSWVWTEGYEPLNAAVSAGKGDREIIFEDRTVNVIQGPRGDRRWERGWRLGDRSGITCKVLICVTESDDAMVRLMVDGRVLAEGVPPWITRRRRGQIVPPPVDADDRQQFYAFLVKFVSAALQARRHS